MKSNRLILALICVLTNTLCVSAQSSNENSTFWKQTKDGFGIYPGIEAVSTPRNLDVGVFAPDLTYIYKGSIFGLGPRIILTNSNSFSNGSTPKESYYGIGTNYKMILPSSNTVFKWFVYYDFEYFYYSFKADTVNIANNYIFNNTYQNSTAYHYNFVTGFGFHLNLTQHIFMSSMLGMGIALEFGKEDNYVNSNAFNYQLVTNEYSHKTLCGQFKLGIGYVF
jgi:hypothetical protein